MPDMQRIAAALAVALMLTGAGPADAGDSAGLLLPVVYDEPPAPDCGAMAARYGPQRLWFGAISGERIDVFFDRSYPHYAQGCFLSEYTCRRWLHENLSYLQGGNLNWMRCQPGVPGRAIY